MIARNTLIAFWARHQNAKNLLQPWYAVADPASWSRPIAVWTFPKAKSLGGDRCCSRLQAEEYRFVVDWKRSGASTKCVGTHADYDTISALTVNLF